MKVYPVTLQFCITAHVSSKQVNVVDDHYEDEIEATYSCFGQEIKGEFEAAAIQADLKHKCEDGEEFDLELPCIVENGRVFHKGQDLSDYVEIEQVEEACWQLEKRLQKYENGSENHAPVYIIKTIAQALGLPAKGASFAKGNSWIDVSQYQIFEEEESLFWASVVLQGKPWDEVLTVETYTATSCIEALYNKLNQKQNGN